MKKRSLILATVLILLSVISLAAVSAEDVVPYYKADDDVIAKYTNEALALKNKIIHSKTDASYTGTAYYISENGNDANDGLTPDTAWKSPLKVSAASFLKAGDAVLFERDGTYRYSGSLSTVAGVTYSAYGSGAKPKLIGSIDASYTGAWNETDAENIYVCETGCIGVNTDIGQIIFDMGAAWGIKVLPGGRIGVCSNGLETVDHGTRNIKNYNDLLFDLEYWHEYDTGKLYLYSAYGNPNNRFSSIEIADKGNGILGNGNNVTIDNLEFFGFGSHGVGYGSANNLTVQNCVFGFIGGSRQRTADYEQGRFGNAVEIFGSGENFTIQNCYAHNVYDCCFTIQFTGTPTSEGVYFRNVEFKDNVAMYSNTGPEIWLSNTGDDLSPLMIMDNVRVHDNYTLYSGYGWSAQRPNKDSNMFYGGVIENTTVYKNCSVDNNVALFPAVYVNHLRYGGSEKYNFNNNIYFQHNDRYYGSMTENPNDGTGKTLNNKYDYETIKNIIDTGYDKGSVFYYVESDYEIERYKPEISLYRDIGEHWGSKDINTAVMRGHMKGISTIEFAPEASTTRAMFVTMLRRIAEEESAFESAPFTDVEEGSWYENSANWAYAEGLVADTKTMFFPDRAITREEMADMMYRLTYNRYKCEEYDGSELTFADAGDVSEHYADAMAFASENGIITGYPDERVLPKNTATRAEVATVVRRYADFYNSTNPDYSRVSDKTDSKIFTADNLGDILTVNRAVLSDSPVGNLLRLNAQNYTNGDVSLTVSEKAAGINFGEYPYVKIRIKVSGGNNFANIALNKNSTIITKRLTYRENEWVDFIVCVYDFIKPGEAYNTNDGKITLYPWGKSTPTVSGINLADIEYIGFFPTYMAASEYESELEEKGVLIKFVSEGKLVDSYYVPVESQLGYTDFIPEKNGYKFAGWNVNEGITVSGDMVVSAVFEKNAGEPTLLFTADNLKFDLSDDMSAKKLFENGESFYRFSTYYDHKSYDGTGVSVLLDDIDIKPKDAPIVKLIVRTNIDSSDAIDLNIGVGGAARLWGPKPEYAAKSMWHEIILDLSKLNYTGGENVDAGLTPEEYFEKYLAECITYLYIKPYRAQGSGVKNGEYIDIHSIAFFETKDDALLYKVDMQANVFGVNNIGATATGGFVCEYLNDEGVKFIRFGVDADSKSADNTRINIMLSENGIDVKQTPVVKMKIRTNIKSSNTIDFNLRPKSNQRIWGPRISYVADSEWHDIVFDMSALAYSGGEGVDKGLTASEYFEKYFTDGVYSFVIKPYSANGLAMKAGEYFDVAGVAFFESAEVAEAYDFPVSKPTAVFNSDNTTTKASKDLSVSVKNENGSNFIHFEVNEYGKSADSTRATVIFDNNEFSVKDAPLVKITFRTNIASSDKIDFNVYPDSKKRIWGSYPEYIVKNEWYELILDMSSLTYSGGEGVDKGLAPAEYFEKYFTGGMYSFMFKPYEYTGLTMKKGEYLDILDIAFYERGNIF